MKRRIIALTVVIMAILAGCLAFYERPMTISELCGVDITKGIAFTCSYQSYSDVHGSEGGGIHEVRITKDDPRYDQLMSLMTKKRFHKTLANVIHFGRIHTWQDGDYMWDVSLKMDTSVEDSDGNTCRIENILIENFFGELTLHSPDPAGPYIISTSDKSNWTDAVYDIISKE